MTQNWYVAGTDEINTKLAQISYNSLLKEIAVEPIITFIDDDGHKNLYDKIRPIAISKGITFGAAIVTGWFDTPAYNTVTREQLDELYALGFEMLGHGNNYSSNLGEFPNDVGLDYQLKEGCKDILEARGYKVNGFVLPQSYSDLRIRQHIKKYYDYCFAVINGINTNDVLDTMRIKRLSFGAYTDANPTINGNSEKNTLNYYKACVDYAVANNGWLIFNTHCGNAEFTDSAYTILSDLIDYIKSLNVKILNPKEGYAIHGNKLFAGDVLSNKYFAVDKYGTEFSSNLDFKRNGLNQVTIATPPSAFKANTISVDYISASFGNTATNFPAVGNSKGVLLTYKFRPTISTDPSNNVYYSDYQEFIIEDSNTVLRRYGATGDTWSEFSTLADVSIPVMNKYSGTNPATDYPIGITGCEISGAHPDVSGFPGGKYGYLVTMRLGTSTNGVFQDFYERGTLIHWKRTWASGAWQAWYKVGTFVGVPASKTATGVAGDYSADVNYFYFCYLNNNWIRFAKDATW